MTPVEALMAQRDAVMFGWERLPSSPNGACAVIRWEEDVMVSLPDQSKPGFYHLCKASRDISSVDPVSYNHDPDTTLDDMLEMFDLAIRYAKEAEEEVLSSL